VGVALKIQFNGQWTADYIRERVVPEFESFRDVVTERIFPVFDNFMTEAKEHGRQWLKEQIARIDRDNPDRDEGIAYFTDEALDKTVDYADTLVGMYFASTALYTLGLFHLFEQHAADLPLRVYNNYNHDGPIALEDVTAWLKDEVSVNVKGFRSWQLIKELQLVANTIKHGEGGAAKRLRRFRRDLFIHPKYRSESKREKRNRMPRRIRKPLLGEDVFITPEEFEKYAGAAIGFWSELADAVAKERP
jgi:hypothetical protein